MVEQLSEHPKTKEKWTVIRTSQDQKYCAVFQIPGPKKMGQLFELPMTKSFGQLFELPKTELKKCLEVFF